MGIQKIEIGDIFEVKQRRKIYCRIKKPKNKSGIMSFRALSHLRYNSFGFINNSIGKQSYASYYPR